MKRFFGGIYFASFIVETIIRFPYAQQSRRVAKTDRRVGLAERSLLAALTIAHLVIPLVYVSTRRLERADYPLSPATRVRVGVVNEKRYDSA